MPQQIDVINKSSFRWKTADGKVLKLHEMETSHIFNSMKMIFNHLAQVHNGKTVNFANEYSLYKKLAKIEVNSLAAQVIFFIGEIERRGDLPNQYKKAYADIKHQIFYDVTKIEEDKKQIATIN